MALQPEYERRLSYNRPSTPPPRRPSLESPLSNSTKKTKARYSDRFIPSRRASDVETEFAMLPDPMDEENKVEDTTYSQILKSELLGSPVQSDILSQSAPSVLPSSPPAKRNLFHFKSEPEPEGDPYSLSPVSVNTQKLLSSPAKKAQRRIPKAPFKVLEAPGIQDDFYLNLVDWSQQNVVAVGLGTTVYLWNATTASVSRLCDTSNDIVTSCAWSDRGNFLAVGTNSGELQIWDTSRAACVRRMPGHKNRVSALAWRGNCITSGSRDRTIVHRDIRDEGEAVKFAGHKQEVCGLRWSWDENCLASGGNDNKLLVWDLAHPSVPLCRFAEHTAAVKAIAWSPHQRGLLASGGGTADRCIRIWNTISSLSLNAVDTGSQVCNLAWSKNVNEIVSTHGYSQNQIVIWAYPSMLPITTLSGHTTRVLYLL